MANEHEFIVWKTWFQGNLKPYLFDWLVRYSKPVANKYIKTISITTLLLLLLLKKDQACARQCVHVWISRADGFWIHCIIFLISTNNLVAGKGMEFKIKTAQSFATVISRKIHENKDTFECMCVKCARAKRFHAFYALQDASVSVSVFNQLQNCYVMMNALCFVVDHCSAFVFRDQEKPIVIKFGVYWTEYGS